MRYDVSKAWMITFAILAIWEIIWKGFALWRAAHRNQKGWFVALLFINSVGILPIIYLQLSGNKETSHEKA